MIFQSSGLVDDVLGTAKSAFAQPTVSFLANLVFIHAGRRLGKAQRAQQFRPNGIRFHFSSISYLFIPDVDVGWAKRSVPNNYITNPHGIRFHFSSILYLLISDSVIHQFSGYNPLSVHLLNEL